MYPLSAYPFLRIVEPDCETQTPDHTEYQKYWGTTGPCTEDHPINPKPTLDNVRWIHLGHDMDLRSSDEWFPEEKIREDIYVAYLSQKAKLFAAVGRTQEQMAAEEYCAKIPGFNEIFPMTTDFERMKVFFYLRLMLELKTKRLCKRYPPVVLVGTAEQMERCKAREWMDSTRLEFEHAKAIREANGENTDTNDRNTSTSVGNVDPGGEDTDNNGFQQRQRRVTI